MDLLDDYLIKLHARELQRAGYVGLIVEEPPRHGKSELGTHYDSVYYLGAHPDERVILASYAAEFASDWGAKCRDTMRKWGKPLYGLEISRAKSAADNWDIKGHRGGMYTAGAGGPITGRGANFLKADDLIKNYSEAQSETLRNNVWNWWTSTFRTRLEPGGIILVIGTRWHEDDIIGRLLAAQGDSPEGQAHRLYDAFADRFLRIRLPAVAEAPDAEFPDPDPVGRRPGQALFPERYNETALKGIRATVGEMQWAALFQQRPTPKEGTLFSEDWFEVVPHPGGRFRKRVRRWDFAATDPKKGEDPDYTVGLLVGLHQDGHYYVEDMVRVRESPGKLMQTLKRTVKRDGRITRQRAEREPGSAGKIASWHLARSAFRGYPFRAVPSTGSKFLRADTVAGAAERGEIKLVRGAWNKAFFQEVTRFPNGTHDDIVDSLSGAYEDMTKRTGSFKTW